MFNPIRNAVIALLACVTLAVVIVSVMSRKSSSMAQVAQPATQVEKETVVCAWHAPEQYASSGMSIVPDRRARGLVADCISHDSDSILCSRELPRHTKFDVFVNAMRRNGESSVCRLGEPVPGSITCAVRGTGITLAPLANLMHNCVYEGTVP